MLCDFNKGIKISSKKKLIPKFISLSSPIEQITAISNDIDFKKIFSFQIENYLEENDVIILLIVWNITKHNRYTQIFAKKKV